MRSLDLTTTYAITFPSTTITATGIRDQGVVLDYFNSFITNFNLALTKLDNDGGVTGVNYNTLWAITDIIDPTTDADHQMFQDGVFQGDTVYLLQNIITNIAGLNAKLDLDGISDTNYAALWDVADTVDDTGC